MSLQQTISHLEKVGITVADDLSGDLTINGQIHAANVPISTGNVLYVRPSHANASDSNTGKRADYPLATLAQAHTNATAGDTIVISGGHSLAAKLTITKSLDIVGLPSGTAYQPETNYLFAAATYTTGPILEVRARCRFYGLTFASRFATGAAVQVHYDSTLGYNGYGVEFSNCRFPDWGNAWGLELKGGSYCLVDTCVFDGSGSTLAIGINMTAAANNNPTHNTIRNCHFTSIANCIETTTNAHACNIRDNVFVDFTLAVDTNNKASTLSSVVANNYMACAAAANAFDQALADLNTDKWYPIGNQYLEA